MDRFRTPFTLIVLTLVLLQAAGAVAETKSFIFLHHSTGRNLMNEGDVRDVVATVSASQDVDVAVWDHDYNEWGLRDPHDQYVGYSFDIPGDNTDPDGLHRLWTTDNAARDSMLSRFDIIAFKSCYYPGARIETDAELQQYKQWYLEIRDELDKHGDKTFIILSIPPLHQLVTEPEWADRARAFADWLGSSEFLAGHPNLVYFDLFDRLAEPDDGSPLRNTLRFEYERTHDIPNGHPNALANSVVGPEFAYLVMSVANGSRRTDAPDLSAALGLEARPNPFNPRTSIHFNLDRDQAVALEVFDVSGRRVRSLFTGRLAAGPQRLDWGGQDDQGDGMPSGTYFCRLTSSAGEAIVPLTLLK